MRHAIAIVDTTQVALHLHCGWAIVGGRCAQIAHVMPAARGCKAAAVSVSESANEITVYNRSRGSNQPRISLAWTAVKGEEFTWTTLFGR
jgi:hypothetical protein